MKRKRLVILAVILAVFLGLVLISTNTKRPTPGSKLKVAATFYPLYDFARGVGGNRVQVTDITPAGAEPHDYEPTPRQLVDVQNSSVFIYDGGAMEPWVGKFLPGYRHVAVKAGRGIKLNGQDPHFWLDPVSAQKIVDNIQAGLAKADPKNKAYFAARAAAYNARLARLDADFKNGLQSCQIRTFVVSHEAFGYMAQRYNLDMVAIAGISPDAEPSAAKLAEVSRLVKGKGIKYIFFERLVSPRLAETIASETGAKTAVLDPIEGISQSDQSKGKDYINVQRENLASLRTALACR